MKTILAFIVAIFMCQCLLAQAENEPLARYVGIDSCRGCHTKPAGAYTTEFVLLDEASVWFSQDKHPDAFRIIAGVETLPNGARINSQALGLNILQRLTADTIPSERFESLAQTGEKVNRELKAIDSNTMPEVQAEQVRQLTKAYLNEAVALYLSAESPVGRGCLACHANLTATTTFNNPVVERSFREASIPDGVSCEACHGPSNLWKSPHESKALERTHFLAAGLAATPENGLEKNWRELTPDQKRQFAMVDVRHAGVRAEQCFSCHIGDKPEGKFIPHAWYRAGHPPLPSMELSTFANAMPRHWRHYPEKGNFDKRPEFLLANHLNTNTYNALQDLPEAKAVVIGGIVALRKTLELLAHVRNEQKLFPDFAAYDCLACHQSLQHEPVITKTDIEPFIPGRPNSPRWPVALAELSFQLTETDATSVQHATFRQAFDSIRTALSQRPFGQPAALQKACEQCIDLLNQQEQYWIQHSLTPQHSQQLQQKIKLWLQTESLDFHTSRQLAWSYQRLTAESGSPIPLDLQNKNGVQAVNDYRTWRSKQRQTFEQQLLNQWPEPQDLLSLQLPSGKQQSIYDNLQRWMSRAANFTPQPQPNWFVPQTKSPLLPSVP